jgi:hypothetical protein
MKHLISFNVTEKFEITGRGAVVVIEEVTEYLLGNPYQVQVTGIDGNMLSATAYKEFMLRRIPTPVEKEAFCLKDLHKDDISDNAVLVFIE